MPPAHLSIDHLIKTHHGRPIRNCPGRYVLSKQTHRLSPADIVGENYRQTVHDDTPAKDRVVVTWIEDWGLISFHRQDGSWCHTVNEPDGFRRKLSALGIDMS